MQAYCILLQLWALAVNRWASPCAHTLNRQTELYLEKAIHNMAIVLVEESKPYCWVIQFHEWEIHCHKPFYQRSRKRLAVAALAKIE